MRNGDIVNLLCRSAACRIQDGVSNSDLAVYLPGRSRQGFGLTTLDHFHCRCLHFGGFHNYVQCVVYCGCSPKEPFPQGFHNGTVTFQYLFDVADTFPVNPDPLRSSLLVVNGNIFPIFISLSRAPYRRESGEKIPTCGVLGFGRLLVQFILVQYELEFVQPFLQRSESRLDPEFQTCPVSVTTIQDSGRFLARDDDGFVLPAKEKTLFEGLVFPRQHPRNDGSIRVYFQIFPSIHASFSLTLQSPVHQFCTDIEVRTLKTSG